MNINEKLKNYIKEEYGSIIKYCRTYEIDPKTVHNLLEPRRNLMKIGALRWIEIFGPLGLDMEAFFKDQTIKKAGKITAEIVKTEKAAMVFKTGKSMEDYSICENAEADFYIDIIDNTMAPRYRAGERVSCRFSDSISQGDAGVFLINGNVCIRFYTEADGVPALSAVGQPPKPVAITDGIRLIGLPC